MPDDKKTAEDIAKEKLAEMSKQKEIDVKAKEVEKKEAEAKGAAVSSPDKTQKTKEELDAEKKEIYEKAEAKVKEDEKILSSKDEELDDTQKARKTELLENKKKRDKEHWQENVNKRIGELTGKIKDLERNDETKTAEIEQLKQEKAELEKKINPPKVTEDDIAKKVEQSNIEKYLAEDKDKPREQRREMPKEELEDWLIEDMTAAQEWMADRSVRRREEREGIRNTISFIKKQHESALKTEKKHPELNTLAREKELAAQGKNPQEVLEVILKENEKYRLCVEIAKEKPELLGKDNTPELIVEEMEKRLTSKTSKDTKKSDDDEDAAKAKEEKDAEIQRLVDEEITRRESLDEGLNSSKRKPKEIPKTDLQKRQLEIARRAHISPERLAAIIERRKGIPGASLPDAEEEVEVGKKN